MLNSMSPFILTIDVFIVFSTVLNSVCCLIKGVIISFICTRSLLSASYVEEFESVQRLTLMFRLHMRSILSSNCFAVKDGSWDLSIVEMNCIRDDLIRIIFIFLSKLLLSSRLFLIASSCFFNFDFPFFILNFIFND